MKISTSLLQLSPQEFISFLKQNNIYSFHFAFDDKTKNIVASHPELLPIVGFLSEDKRDFAEHEGIFFRLSRNFEVLFSAFIHKTCRGQAAGGLRFWNYDNMEDYIRDGLRLSKGMTQKNALAGIWWGGGKGIMSGDSNLNKNNPQIRAILYKEYGAFITDLKGCYITAEDVGTNENDMANVYAATRYTTCIPPQFGGSGNPSMSTAQGVISGMEAILNFNSMGTLQNKTIAVQGAGNVGVALIFLLLQKGVNKLIVSDISLERLNALKANYPNANIELKHTPPGDNSILAVPCDIFAPCGIGGILNPRTIPTIQTKIICGAANNQLEDIQRDERLLMRSQISYLPDFLVNRMGIVNCANEQYGYIKYDQEILRHFDKQWEFSIYQTALRVLQKSHDTNIPAGKIATELADQLALTLHPLFGHRGQQIINSLIEDNWHLNDGSIKIVA